jgi:hypothetical protein
MGIRMEGVGLKLGLVFEQAIENVNGPRLEYV